MLAEKALGGRRMHFKIPPSSLWGTGRGMSLLKPHVQMEKATEAIRGLSLGEVLLVSRGSLKGSSPVGVSAESRESGTVLGFHFHPGASPGEIRQSPVRQLQFLSGLQRYFIPHTQVGIYFNNSIATVFQGPLKYKPVTTHGKFK